MPKAVLCRQALAHLAVPELIAVLRKASGPASFSLAGSPDVADLFLAWLGAEIGFMDPQVGADVLDSDQLQALPGRNGSSRCNAERPGSRRPRTLTRRSTSCAGTRSSTPPAPVSRSSVRSGVTPGTRSRQDGSDRWLCADDLVSFANTDAGMRGDHR